jgi:hypothetical protein
MPTPTCLGQKAKLLLLLLLFNFEVNGSGPLYLKVVIMTVFCSVDVTCESELENLDAVAPL